MKITEDLKKYLNNNFIDDVLSKIVRPNIKMTSEDVWGKEIKLPFYHDGIYDMDTFELESWAVKIDLSQIDTVRELIDLAVEQISELENSRIYELDPFDVCDDTIVCHQLCDWRVLRDEDEDPLQDNLLTLIKYAKFIDMTKYIIGSNAPSFIDKLTINETPIITANVFTDLNLEEAYKQGIRDTLNWLTDPANKDVYSDESIERPYYFVYEDEIDNFVKEKGIECKTK